MLVIEWCTVQEVMMWMNLSLDISNFCWGTITPSTWAKNICGMFSGAWNPWKGGFHTLNSTSYPPVIHGPPSPPKVGRKSPPFPGTLWPARSVSPQPSLDSRQMGDPERQRCVGWEGGPQHVLKWCKNFWCVMICLFFVTWYSIPWHSGDAFIFCKFWGLYSWEILVVFCVFNKKLYNVLNIYYASNHV